MTCVQMAGEQLEITHCADGLLMAVLGPLCVAFWCAKPTPTLFQIQRSHLAKAVARAPGKVAFLCAVAEHSPPPDERERAASSAMISEHGAALAGVAAVIEGSGFRAAITRTVLSGIMFVIRSPSPIRMFESVPLATPWLVSRVGDAVVTLPTQFALVRSKVSSAAA